MTAKDKAKQGCNLYFMLNMLKHYKKMGLLSDEEYKQLKERMVEYYGVMVL